MNILGQLQTGAPTADTPFMVSYDFTKLDHLDSWMYVVISFIGTLTSLMLFLGHILSPKLRKPPGDLVMMVSLAEFLLSAHWFSSGLKTDFFFGYDKDPNDPAKPVVPNSSITFTADGLAIGAVENGHFEKISSKPEGIFSKLKRLLGAKGKHVPSDESNFCIGEAYVAVSGATLEVGYNVAFLYYIFQTAR